MPTFDEMFLARSATTTDTDEFLPPLGWRQKDRAGLIVHSSGSSSFHIFESVYDRLTESQIRFD